MTNTIVTVMLVLGGAAVIHSLTGVNIYLASFLIPVGVIVYTFFGGLKATFFADYLNAAFIWSCSCLRYFNVLSESRFGRSSGNV